MSRESREENTTHFGYREVPETEKHRLVGEVFRSVASKYDLMNDLMSLGVHRYIGLTGLQWLMIYLRVNLMAQVGQSIIYDMRARLFEHLQDLSLSFYSRYSVGRVITRVINDVSVLRQFITWAIVAHCGSCFFCRQ